MKHKPLFVTLAFLCFSAVVTAQVPSGFEWTNLKTSRQITTKVEQALKAEPYTAIREIGTQGGFALVFTVSREENMPTPDYDVWTVYSVSLTNLRFKKLLVGHKLEIKDWLRFSSGHGNDLGVTYLDCWECEPATLFTAFHFDGNKGWTARWPNPKQPDMPGILLQVTDVGDPYTDEDVDQVFAVLTNREKEAAVVGIWYWSKDLKTGKVSSTTTKYFVDPVTGKERSLVLTGKEAASFQSTLCHPEGGTLASGGQDSHSCKRTIKKVVSPTSN